MNKSFWALNQVVSIKLRDKDKQKWYNLKTSRFTKKSFVIDGCGEDKQSVEDFLEKQETFLIEGGEIYYKSSVVIRFTSGESKTKYFDTFSEAEIYFNDLTHLIPYPSYLNEGGEVVVNYKGVIRDL